LQALYRTAPAGAARGNALKSAILANDWMPIQQSVDLNSCFFTSIFFFYLTLLKRKHRQYNSGLSFTPTAKSLILRDILLSRVRHAASKSLVSLKKVDFLNREFA